MHPSARHRTPLIGRDRPLAEVRRAMAAASAGAGSLILVSGEPGIGKTRLAEEAAGGAADLGVEVAWGRCHEVEGRPPFWPWVQVLRTLALRLGPAEVAAVLDPDTAPLARLVPELRHMVAGGHDTPDSESARFRLFLGFASFLRWAAARRPQTLILDDLHWADVPSLRFLEFLSHELGELPIAVVATYREAEIRQNAGTAALVGGLLRRGRALELTGFSVDEVADFVGRAGGAGMAERWSRQLYDITDGNPYFLDEMLRLLEARGELPASGTPLPHGVVATIRQRLGGLAPDVVERLAAAAVLGRAFDVDMLATVDAAAPADVRTALEPALALEVVRPLAERPERWRFAHALVREALLGELPSVRRAALHARVAVTLEERRTEVGVQSSEIAHHYAAAAMQSPTYVEKAVDWSEYAGDEAMRALAFEDAAAHFDRALQWVGNAPTPRRCELLLRLGDASNRAGSAEESAAAYTAAANLARRLSAPLSLARAAIGSCGVGSTWAQFGRSDPRLIDGLNEALVALPADEKQLRARAMARLASELHFAPTPTDTDAISRDAVALARSTGDPATLAYTLPARLRCSTPEQRDERCTIIDELLQLTGGRGELAVHALVWGFSEALQAGDLTSVATRRAALLAAVHELRQARDLWLVPALQAQEHLLAGRWAEAERAAETILAHEGLSPNGSMVALVLLFLVRREQGRLAELTDGMRAFALQAPTITAWRTNFVQLLAETGDLAAARAEVDSFVTPRLARIKYDNTWMLAAAGAATATALVGTPEQAQVVYDALQPFDGRHITAASFFYHGPVAHYLGILAQRAGHADAARRHLDDAVAATERLGAIPWSLRCQAARQAGPGRSAPSPAASAAPVGRMRSATLSRHLRSWRLTYGGRTAHLKARRGLDYLARLLAEPEREFHVLDLAAAEASPTVRNSPVLQVLDERAKRELRTRLTDLRTELAEAEAHHDLARADLLRDEVEAIGTHLARALGLHGNDRPHDDAERARAAVTKALRAAVRQIGEAEPELATLLDRSIRTGTFCSYTPLHEAGIVWHVGDADDADAAP